MCQLFLFYVKNITKRCLNKRIKKSYLFWFNNNIIKFVKSKRYKSMMPEVNFGYIANTEIFTTSKLNIIHLLSSFFARVHDSVSVFLDLVRAYIDAWWRLFYVCSSF